jgi:phage host-nuclease inhibitor protein Gam
MKSIKKLMLMALITGIMTSSASAFDIKTAPSKVWQFCKNHKKALIITGSVTTAVAGLFVVGWRKQVFSDAVVNASAVRANGLGFMNPLS